MGRTRRGLLIIASLSTIMLISNSTLPSQTTWHVDDNAFGDPGPGNSTLSDPDEDGSAEHPFDAIQEAIDAAYDGDTVLVADGTYQGPGNRDMDYQGLAIVLKSENGPENCVIDCEGSELDPHRAFYFQTEEDADSVLHGFTIRNGYQADYNAGAIYCYQASPTIAGNIFIGNTSLYSGGAMYCDRSSPSITDNTFSGNTAKHSGGAIFLYYASPLISGNVFSGNLTTGTDDSNSYGGAIALIQEAPKITNNLISGNTATGCG